MTDLNNLLLNIEDNIGSDTNALAKILRGLMYDMNIGPLQMSQLLTRWLDNPRNGIPKTGSGRSNKRGNLIKEIAKPRITWPVFEKAIVVLAPATYSVTVKLTMQDGKTFQRELKVNLNNPEEYDNLVRSSNSGDGFVPVPVKISPQPLSPEDVTQIEKAKASLSNVTCDLPAYASKWIVKF